MAIPDPPIIVNRIIERRFPQLLWSGLSISRANVCPEDREAFPEWSEIVSRKRLHEVNYIENNIDKDYPPYCLKCFSLSLEEAIQRLWILDPHFDAIGARSILPAFYITRVENIRIINTRKEGRDRWLKELSLARNSKDFVNSRPAGDVQWTIAVEHADILHDRFAVVDDELWHFGSTVGGGYPFLTAGSRGWDARNHEGGTKAIQFYQRLWKTLTRRDIEEER